MRSTTILLLQLPLLLLQSINNQPKVHSHLEKEALAKVLEVGARADLACPPPTRCLLAVAALALALAALAHRSLLQPGGKAKTHEARTDTAKETHW